MGLDKQLRVVVICYNIIILHIHNPIIILNIHNIVQNIFCTNDYYVTNGQYCYFGAAIKSNTYTSIY